MLREVKQNSRNDRFPFEIEGKGKVVTQGKSQRRPNLFCSCTVLGIELTEKNFKIIR